MKTKSTLIKFFVIFSIVFFSFLSPSVVISDRKALQSDLGIFSGSYISRNSIEIISDNGLRSFPGSGTPENPFIIEGFNITTENDFGIYITETTKHFIIRNCYIDASYRGIYLNNIAKGTGRVENNICKNSEVSNGFGIEIEKSENIVIVDNICTGHDLYGIAVIYSDNSTIKSNICSRNGGSGIISFSSENPYIYNNTCVENEDSGMIILSSSSSLVERNSCSKNSIFGIVLWDSNESIVVENTIDENKEYGISLSWNYDSVLSYNTLQKNGYHGVSLDHFCYFNEIYYNNFIENNYFSLKPQAIDNGTNNLWSNLETKKGNYWSDKQILLKNYPIDGSANSIDYYPQKEQIEREDEKTEDVSFRFSIINGVLIVFVFYFRKKNRKTQFFT